MNTCVLILGDQLFDPKKYYARLVHDPCVVFMREDIELCTRFRYHKHKLILFLAAMRHFAALLKTQGVSVHYEPLEEASSDSYASRLVAFLRSRRIQQVKTYDIADRFFAKQIALALREAKITLTSFPSPMFLARGVSLGKPPIRMLPFYIQQRKKLSILLEANGTPTGGAWSFDKNNRLPLPKSIAPPSPFNVSLDAKDAIVSASQSVDRFFGGHPGDTKGYWIPITHREARLWLKRFLSERLRDFGPYEDALAPHAPFGYHAMLTPFLNTGLLTPQEVIKATLSFARTHAVPINSLEGFIRQVIGWREFIKAVDTQFGEEQYQSNFWGHQRYLSDRWYRGETGIPPLDTAIEKAKRYGYAHHIERLMVLGNMMLLLEVHPHEALRWFMEMFVDSADWVMGPNVFGMALMSDGGVFATKPYICGANYYRKMGGYPQGDWCQAVDGLYWSFIERHRPFFEQHPRLSMMTRLLDRMPSEKKQRLYTQAEHLRERLTIQTG